MPEVAQPSHGGLKVVHLADCAAARYLDAVARKDDAGWLVFHHEPNGEDLFYLSWCHGPPGTARLFDRLNQITMDQSSMERVHRCARGTMATGIPEQRTPGFWNSISQCCGNCGVGEFFLSLHRLAPEADYIAMARRAAGDTLKRATPEGDGLKWIQAEHRVRPELLIAQTGFMQGGQGRQFLPAPGRARAREEAHDRVPGRSLRLTVGSGRAIEVNARFTLHASASRFLA